jgi:hypothetical protein
VSLVSVLGMKATKMVAVALEGIESVLKIGKESLTVGDENLFATELENANGIDILEDLQQHPN